MAVEKMKLMSGIFQKDNIDDVLNKLVLSESLHLSEENLTENFTIEVLKTRNADLIKKLNLDTSLIRPFEDTNPIDYKEVFSEYKSISDFLGEDFDAQIDENRDILDDSPDISLLNKFNDDVFKLKNELQEIESKINKVNYQIEFAEFFKKNNSNDIDLYKMVNLNKLGFVLGVMPTTSYDNLKANYENINHFFLHAGKDIYNDHSEEELIIVFYYKKREQELVNLLKSFNFSKINISEFNITEEDTALSLIKKAENKKADLFEKKETILSKIGNYFSDNKKDILSVYYRYKVLEKTSEIKAYVVQSPKYYILTGFIPESKVDMIKNDILNSYPDSIVAFEDAINVSDLVTIPTSLKNNWFFSPFESMIHMYSTPSYNEFDPTGFFALTYMLLFGMMFGDVGQGAIFVLVGFLFRKKLGSIAQILQRIGISSIIFGFLYGSIFGLESVIPALIIRPMEKVNNILGVSIVIGIVLLSISYFIGFKNLSKRKNNSALFFNKNGISGYVFYINFLLFIIIMAMGSKLSNNLANLLRIISIFGMIITAVLMFLEEDFSEKMAINSGEKITHKEKSSCVERGFELYETVLNIFSNTLSFIRVGAFAINHVGLFMAFHSLGQMTGSSVLNILMIVVGNIVILVLEGLIVGIQSIRLEYYELFSKYFNGNGVKYDPVKMK